MSEKIRVLIAKTGSDGHTRGATVVATALRDAGMEVVIAGLNRTVEEVFQIAVEEDVDVIGLSVLDGTHMMPFTRLARILKEKVREDILLIGGGIIPPEEREELKRRGVAELFPPGTPTERIVEFIRSKVAGDDAG